MQSLSVKSRVMKIGKHGETEASVTVHNILLYF